MAKSILEQYHFTEGEKLKGGFPIRILLEEDQEKKNLIGGGLVESIGMDKFNDYAIPIGLVSFQDRQFKLTEKKSSKREPEVINDDLFDKLFMAVSKQRKTHNKTKKKGAAGSF
jgi:hypothetical protein